MLRSSTTAPPPADTTAPKREFKLENEVRYDRSGPVRWIVSHLLRYPILPLIAVLAAILNNWAYSMIQVSIGRAFDVITAPGWLNGTAPLSALAALALTVAGIALTQGISGLARNYSFEFLAQRTERDTRDELYISLLGKSQTFHGRQRIGDVMARATNDVRALNFMFNPGFMLITDSLMAIIVPFFLIGRLFPQLLLVPSLFVVALIITVWTTTAGLSRSALPCVSSSAR